MHALAAVLGTTVQTVERVMSAREFSHWCIWMSRERVGPAWDRLRHAEILAAIYNGATTRAGGGAFGPADFLPPDPWQVSELPTTKEEEARLLRAQVARLEGAFG